MKESEFRRSGALIVDMGNLSVPPGFTSLTSFTLKKVGKDKETDKSTTFLTESEHEHEPVCMGATSEMDDIAAYDQILNRRPWILFNHSDCNPKSNTEHHSMDLPIDTSRPKGVTRGCPDCSDCLKVTARWRPEDARRDVLKEAPVFHPTEEEFKDTLNYIASIHSIAEPYGICRIIPPASWQPPCRLKEKNLWESSDFVTQVQRIDGVQVQCAQQIAASSCEETKTKQSSGIRVALGSQLGNGCNNTTKHHDVEDESKFGPKFSLKTFKEFANEFKVQYFDCKNKAMGSDINSSMCQEQWEISVENLEGEYGRIVQNPTEEIEVLCGENLEAGVLSSGFPTESDPMETSKYPEYLKSGWNLNNIHRLSGSLLSFESSDALHFVPRIHVGMCFSSLSWKVEEHRLYSLCYNHLGEPKVWYSVPGRFAVDFESVQKKYLPDLFSRMPESHDNQAMQLSSAVLKSEGIPVYRCLQNCGEFVLVFPGAYHSGFDCGFNCSEAVSFAPLQWLLYGQNSVEVYCEQRRKTLLSYDKLLLGAAKEAVRAQWEIELCKRSTPDNLRWKDVCGRDGILAKAFNSRTRSEKLKRECLCTSLKSTRMEKDFDATCKRECNICLRDLHLSAIGCLCLTDKFACLNHAKQLCSCNWSNKYLLYRYEISELDVLCQALNRRFNAVLKWAKEDLGLTVLSAVSERSKQTPGNGSRSMSFSKDPKHQEFKPQGVDTLGGTAKATASGVMAEVRAAILNAMKRKQNAEGSPDTATSRGTNSSSSGIGAKLKVARLVKSVILDESKEEQGTAGTTCFRRGINVAPSTKTGMKAHVGQSTNPDKVEEDPKVSAVSQGATSKYLSLIRENAFFEVSSESSSSSTSSESEDA